MSLGSAPVLQLSVPFVPPPPGILVYEMLSGYPPFFDDNPFGIYEKILAGKIEWPRHIDPVAKDLVKKLLVQDRTKRLGNMKVRGQPRTRGYIGRGVKVDTSAGKGTLPTI